ncbi:MAG: MBL fold metallo-hydrolase [Gemmatimonadetes bacterium]|nr:MBL fold metallo-hydrolase [Gemmatimonadota bacterium]
MPGQSVGFADLPGSGGHERGLRDVLRWQLQRLRHGRAPDPPSSAWARALPDVTHAPVPAGECRITWVGHATFLIQLPGANVLTDPIWSSRASPVPWLGPARLVPPGLPFDALPAIDVVLLSHDHYDHLDRPTAERLHERYGQHITWVTPHGYARWFGGLGVTRVAELDWWRTATFADGLACTALPARHWSRRLPWETAQRHWASFALAAPGGVHVYFCGDSGYTPSFAAIGERAGPFDVALLPIGAYEPRWFMHTAHMNPEEAVQAWLDLGGRGLFVPMHWGTFRLTDEPPLEPPERLRAAWAERRLPGEALRVLRHGETARVQRAGGERAEPA